MREAIVGIIGGIGPEATLDLFSTILARTRADSASDHLHLIIDCNPKYASVNASVLGAGPSVAPQLCRTAKMLETAGAGLLALACNAAHAYAPEIRAAVNIPLLCMIDATAAEAAALLGPDGRVGILATDGCLAAGLYQSALRSVGLEPVTPDDRDTARLMDALTSLGSARAPLIELAERLIERRVELLIAACTEITLVLQPGDLPISFLDPIEILATACIRASGSEPNSSGAKSRRTD